MSERKVLNVSILNVAHKIQTFLNPSKFFIYPKRNIIHRTTMHPKSPESKEKRIDSLLFVSWFLLI